MLLTNVDLNNVLEADVSKSKASNNVNDLFENDIDVCRFIVWQ